LCEKNIIEVTRITAKTEFLTPDYYEDFSCKIGDCRHSCCEGWTVSLPMEEYFRLLSLECPAELRSELDCALRVFSSPSKERYAELSHRYDGKCRLMAPDGKCTLHARMGEKHLPEICRLYPRSVKADGSFERACSASCEKVVEMLLYRSEPVRFIKKEAPANVSARRASASAPPSGYEEDLKQRMFFISLMQDRRFSIPARLFRTAKAMMFTENAVKNGGVFDEKPTLQHIDEAKPEFSAKYISDHLALGLASMRRLTESFEEDGRSIREYAKCIIEYFGDDEKTYSKYISANNGFASHYPSWAEGFENLLVNHMFLTEFPFSGADRNFENAYLSLCAVYVLMRFLSVGTTAIHADKDELTDVIAAAFRYIEHTDFHTRASKIMKYDGFANAESIAVIVNL